jgi:hypothetical protein
LPWTTQRTRLRLFVLAVVMLCQRRSVGMAQRPLTLF